MLLFRRLTQGVTLL